jgi:hypothetical protein
VTPPHLNLGDHPAPYVGLLWVLFALFLARVLGQILAATIRPAWLPPMARWYSGLMPYRYLLPSQLLIIALMIAMVLGLSSTTGSFGTPRATVGIAVAWASYIYAAGMVWRAMHRARLPVERRGVVLPIVFHFVLAAFLFVYASWHLVRSAG